MTSTSDGSGLRGHARVSSPSSLGLSLERLLEVAHATGELLLTCRNLKTFPKHRCKYDLKDTVTVGKFRKEVVCGFDFKLKMISIHVFSEQI